MMNDDLQSRVGEVLLNEGIELFGFTPLPSGEELGSILSPAYLSTLPRSLDFLKKPAWRNPLAYLPWAKNAVCAALPYNTSRERSTDRASKGRCWISRYAWSEDYHSVVRKKLKPVESFLIGKGFKAKTTVDSFPVLEKTLAVKAGLGFKGKNGVIINPKHGSYLFLGEVLTDAEFPAARPMEPLCGDCRLCVSACPSKAIADDGRLDPSLCVSSFNVEWKGAPPGSSPPLSGRLFGCDICQEACPFNKEAPLSMEPSFSPRAGLFAPDVSFFTEGDSDAIGSLIKETPLERRGADGLRDSAEKIRRESQTKSEETELSS